MKLNTRYEIAKLAAGNASVENLQCDIPKPDGQFAFRKALREETAALQEYRRVLQVFNDLVLNGKVPDRDA